MLRPYPINRGLISADPCLAVLPALTATLLEILILVLTSRRAAALLATLLTTLTALTTLSTLTALLLAVALAWIIRVRASHRSLQLQKVRIDSGELFGKCRLCRHAIESIKGMKMGLTRVALRRDRQRKCKRRSELHTRLNANRSTEHRFRNFLHHRESDSGSLPRWLGREAPIENPRKILGRDSLTRVTDREIQMVAVTLERHMHGAPCAPRSIDGVPNQIRQHLIERP
jgi:hypothetical protein